MCELCDRLNMAQEKAVKPSPVVRSAPAVARPKESNKNGMKSKGY